MMQGQQFDGSHLRMATSVKQQIERGISFQNAGMLTDAEACYRGVIDVAPQNLDALYLLGLALHEQNDTYRAIEYYARALSIQPKYAEAHNSMGVALQSIGDLTAAMEHYQRALLLKPNFVEVHVNMAGILHFLNRFAEAATHCYEALSIQPNCPSAYNNLGLARMYQGSLTEAVESFRMALVIKPDFAEARWKQVTALVPLVVMTQNEIAECRRRLPQEIADLDAWFEGPRAALGHQAVGGDQLFYLAYQEENNRDILRHYGRLCARLMSHWQDSEKILVSRPDQHAAAGGVVRVGLVSAHIRDHSVWNAIVKGWVRHLDRERIALTIFHVGAQEDEDTAWAKAHCACFEEKKTSLQQWVSSISDSQIDVLIYPEIGMDILTTRLASQRIAPVQIAAWGHPETSGLPTIDYYLSSECFEPVEAQNYYTERLVKLPNLGCCYLPQEVQSSQVDLANLGINPDVPLLICPGAPFKYSPQYDQVFVDIARQLGSCQFIFFGHAKRELSEKLQQRLRLAFEVDGLDFNDHCVFIPWQEPAKFFGLMKRADVFLDTIGFSGFNTAMQAIECGLPVVTREGRFMRGRLASGILRRVNLTELIAESSDAYVALAVKLVRDSEYRQLIRQRITSAQDLLFDDVLPVRALESFLIDVVAKELN